MACKYGSKLLFLFYVASLIETGVCRKKLSNTFKDRQSIKKERENTECSIHRSSYARRILSQGFNPIYEANNIDVPFKCPFNNTRDIYYELELYKVYQTTARWKCELCGKFFYTEQFIDGHFLRKHGNLISKNKDAVCLADYCDVLRCDLHQSYPEVPEKIQCENKVAISLQRACEKLMRECLPDSENAHQIYDATSLHFCSTLTCEKFLTPFQDSVSIWTVLLLSMAIPAMIIGLGSLCFYILDSLEDHETSPRKAKYALDPALYENTYEHVVKQRGSRLRYRNLIHGEPLSSRLGRKENVWRYKQKHRSSDTLGLHGSLLEPINSKNDWLAIDIG